MSYAGMSQESQLPQKKIIMIIVIIILMIKKSLKVALKIVSK